MAGEMPHIEGVEHRFVTAGDLRVHVAQAGSGPPIVLQHGWPQHWWMWRHVIGPLSERHRVICPDLRGHGWTDAPPGGYAKERLASDLLAVLDALELDRVKLVGHDWGGFAGFLACLSAPERFSSFLALSIPHPWPSGGRDPRQLVRLWYQAALASPLLGQALVQRGIFVPRLLQGGRESGRYSDEEVEAYQAPWRERARAQATVSLYRTFLLRELSALVRGRYRDRRLTVPTRLVVGEKDPVFQNSSLDGFQAHADDMEVEWLAGVAHFVPEEVPEVVVERALALPGDG